MPRRPLFRTNEFPYHVVMRSNNKEWFPYSMSQIWFGFEESLYHAHSKYPIILHAGVLMDNHYHLVLTTPDSNIDKFMYTLNKEFSSHIRDISKRINRVFGARYKWSVIKTDQHYYNVIKYVFANPIRVKRGLIYIRDYPYSSYYLDPRKIKIDPRINIYDPEFLKWVEKSYTPKQVECMRRGLGRSEFRYSPDPISKKIPKFDSIL